MVHGLATIKGLHEQLEQARKKDEDVYVPPPSVDLSNVFDNEFVGGRYVLGCLCFEGNKVTGTDSRVLAEFTLQESLSDERVLLCGHDYQRAFRMMNVMDAISPRLVAARIEGEFFLVCDNARKTPGELVYFKIPWTRIESKFPEVGEILDPKFTKKHKVEFKISAHYLKRVASLIPDDDDRQSIRFRADIDQNGGFSSLSFSRSVFEDDNGGSFDLRGVVMLMNELKDGEEVYGNLSSNE